MKKLVFFSVAVFTAVSTQAQQYFHLPDSNAVWKCLNNVQISVSGSVTQNNKVYKKYTSNGNPYLLREDTVTKRVYILSAQDTTQENLLYDFSLQVNQTATVYPVGQWVGIKVQSIDSVLIGNNYRKRLQIVNPTLMFQEFDIFQEYWIEGIGSTSGVLFSGENAIPLYDLCHNTLLCYEQNGVELYHHPHYGNNCSAICVGGGVKEYTNKINLAVYPNPTSNSITVKLPVRKKYGVYKIELSNMFGEVCKEISSVNTKAEIDLSQLQSGIYFLQVFEERNLVAVEKIVKE